MKVNWEGVYPALTTKFTADGQLDLVLFEKNDGKIVAISDEAICEYDNQEALDESRPAVSAAYSQAQIR